MKKQISPAIKAHLIRSAFYLLLLFAVFAIPFALAQRASGKRNRPGSLSRLSTSQLPIASSGPIGATIVGNPAAPKLPNAVLYDQVNNPGTNVTASQQNPGTIANCNYTFSQSSGEFVRGEVDIGNHCRECSTFISLPFPVSIYGQTYTSVAPGSNGS
jgi:hypothetical protein